MIEIIVDDWMFNATALVMSWNKEGIACGLDKFVELFVGNNDNIVEFRGEDVFLPLVLEPQLRMYAANYDIEVYDKINAEIIITTICNIDNLRPINDDTRLLNGSMKTYLMIEETSGAVKIGRSHNPRFREHTLSAQIPKIKLIAICNSDVEKKLHTKYASKRMRGEWFNLTNRDIATIIRDYGFQKMQTPKLLEA